jgi:methionine synthase II (cobalamin-independent)
MTPRTSTNASDRDYVFAIAEALREEYLEIINAGLILQVDDAVLANMYDELVQESPARIARGVRFASRRSTTRCGAFPRRRFAITSASEAGTCRTWPTRQCPTSSI